MKWSPQSTRPAQHSPLDGLAPALDLPGTKPPSASTGKSGASFRTVVSVFIAGLSSGALLVWLVHDEQLTLVHGYARKAGVMHVDPTGIEYWDESINGARGTSGLREPSRR